MIPHKCPVCEGTGNVQPGFYGWDLERVPCRSCKGTGVLWQERERTLPVRETLPALLPLDCGELVLLP